MKLTINREFNELYGVLSSLFIISNFEYFKEQVEEKWNIEFKVNKDEILNKISKKHIFQEAKHFIDMNLSIRDIFINSDLLRTCQDLDEYIFCLKNKKEDEIRIDIYQALGFDDLLQFKERPSIDLIIEKLDKEDFHSDIKWFKLALINNPMEYIYKFIGLIHEYLPLYEEIKEDFKEEYNNFVIWIEKNINSQGIDFIEGYLGFLNLSQYSEVYLNYSLFDLLSSHSYSDRSLHIYIGIMFKNYVEEQMNKEDIDKHLMVYKVLSDKTRFEIIKLLTEEESYGQGIAEKLGVTTATVSYHMDYLLGASLITTKRKSRRLYFSINKDQIKESISFLEKELKI